MRKFPVNRSIVAPRGLGWILPCGMQQGCLPQSKSKDFDIKKLIKMLSHFNEFLKMRCYDRWLLPIHVSPLPFKNS